VTVLCYITINEGRDKFFIHCSSLDILINGVNSLGAL
jgi:hypothetical protein